MSDNVLVSDLVHKIPISLSVNDKFDPGIIAKTTRSVVAQPQLFSPTGISVINLALPPIGWVNFANSYIQGELGFSQGLELTGSVHSLFRRIVGRAPNGTVLFDLDGYNVLSAAIQDFSTSAEEQSRALAITTLSGTNDQRKSYWSGRQFCFQPLVDMLRSNSTLPLHLMGGLNIELHLDSTSTIFMDGNNPLVSGATYAVQNVRYVLDVHSMSEQNEALARQAFMAGKLKYHFSNWRMQPAQSDSFNYDLTLQAENSTKGVIVIPRRAAYLQDITKNSFGRLWAGMQQVQWSLGSNMFDVFKCTHGAAQIFQEAQKLLHFTQSVGFDPSDWYDPNINVDSTAYLLALNAESIPHESQRFLSGYTGKGTMNVNIRYGNTVPLISYFSYILYDVVMTVSDSNGVTLFS